MACISATQHPHASPQVTFISNSYCRSKSWGTNYLGACWDSLARSQAPSLNPSEKKKQRNVPFESKHLVKCIEILQHDSFITSPMMVKQQPKNVIVVGKELQLCVCVCHFWYAIALEVQSPFFFIGWFANHHFFIESFVIMQKEPTIFKTVVDLRGYVCGNSPSCISHKNMGRVWTSKLRDALFI